MEKLFLAFKIRRSSLKERGDTILEVVIATAILSTLLIATFDILQRALDTNVNVKNRVIALNIAREGIEAVRNVRDTNWLRYSGERRDKWLCLDVPGGSNACTGNTPSTSIINNDSASDDTYYRIDFNDTDNRYYLERATLQDQIDFDNPQTGRDQYQLYLTQNPPVRYTHEPTTGADTNTPTIFYRQVWLDIENPYETFNATIQALCGTGDSNDSCRKGRLDVVVRVFWQEEGRTRTLTLETNLYDFYERDAY